MNKHIIPGVIFALLLCCQTQPKEAVRASMVDPQQEPPQRSVEGNTLISHQLPPIKIEVAEEFSFVGSFDFEIIAASDEYPKEMQGKPVAAGERFVFAVWDADKVIEKLFIVQLEGFLPSNDFKYNYNFDHADFMGENKYRHNTWFYDSKKSAQQNPHSEGARTRTFLQEKGFQLADQFMMSRFVGLASTDRKHEIIIFYLEMLTQTTGYILRDFEQSISSEEREAIEGSLVKRSRKSFTIIEG